MDRKRRNTLAIKAISVFLGILLWLFVTNENVIITRHTVSAVSVTAVNLGAGLKAVYNGTVDLEVAGKTADRASFRATIDLSGMGAGKHLVPVRVKSPSGVKLVKAVPTKLTVNIMEVNEKVVSVKVVLDKEPPTGYRMTGLVPSPAQVLVRGGYPDVLKVAEVRAGIDLLQVKDATTIPLTFIPVDREGQEIAHVSVVPTQGQAYVVVEADKKEESRPIKLETKGNLVAGYEVANIIIEPTTVKVLGSQEALSQITEVVTEPLDVEGVTNNIFQEVKLVPVPGAVFNPASVLVSIEIKSGSAKP